MPPAVGRSDAPLRILVVDADDRVRESLTGLLAIGERVKVVGGAGQAETALALAREQRPDVVVVDPRLPELDGGVRFITSLRACCPGIRVVAMSWSDALERPAIDGGAHGFIRKTFRPTELIAAIVAAARPADA